MLRIVPILCAIIGLSAAPLRAQLTVDRLDVTLPIAASGRTTASFVVHNAGKKPAQAMLSRGDWDRAENGENRFVPSGSTRNSCGGSLNVFPTSARIEPGADQIIRLTVEKAEVSRECWDVVFVEEFGQKQTMVRSGLEYVLRTGVKVYAVPSGLARSASITGMALDSSNIARSAASATRPVKQRLSIKFTNDGGVHLAAKGRIEFRRPDNSVALQLPIAEFSTLPGAMRRLDLDVPPTLGSGSYIALVLIDFGGSEIAAGQLEIDR